LPPFCKHGALVGSLPAVLTVGSLKWFQYAVRLVAMHVIL